MDDINFSLRSIHINAVDCLGSEREISAVEHSRTKSFGHVGTGMRVANLAKRNKGRAEESICFDLEFAN